MLPFFRPTRAKSRYWASIPALACIGREIGHVANPPDILDGTRFCRVRKQAPVGVGDKRCALTAHGHIRTAKIRNNDTAQPLCQYSGVPDLERGGLGGRVGDGLAMAGDGIDLARVQRKNCIGKDLCKRDRGSADTGGAASTVA